MIRIPRSQYAELYGPTTGDRIRLADTELWIQIERDHTVYGDEVCFGGGKVIRDGMGQSQISNADGAMDTVITNAVIMDAALGIIKADLGIRDGRIAAGDLTTTVDTKPGDTSSMLAAMNRVQPRVS